MILPNQLNKATLYQTHVTLLSPVLWGQPLVVLDQNDHWEQSP